jgi:2-succinyl-5-enolpyruvyl-6-hydroxy-3-cyclohexene-1-carboxylate synthase
MTSDKKNVHLLAELFVKKGLSDIIISPGSRNAPVIIAFAGKPGVRALSIVDERSAAFFALGMAQKTGKTVAVTCTSGSAALNYAPAIAEAYYRKVPLLVLTADRPPELIDRGYGQTIRQRDVYRNYIKAGFELPVEIEDESTLKEAEKIVNKAFNLTQFPEPGPVHINIPFREPLYGTMQEFYDPEVKDLDISHEEIQPLVAELAEAWNRHGKVMIIAGQQNRHDKLNSILKAITRKKKAVLLSETTSNLHSNEFIDCIDNVVSTFKGGEIPDFQPDLLITFGGQVVSKMVKKLLRDHSPHEHWHISPSGEQMDTYFKLKKVIPAQPAAVFETLLPLITEKPDDFVTVWQERKAKVVARKKQYLQQIPFSDLKVFDYLLTSLPEQINLHLGNSTPVRYSQLFGSDPRFHYFSNRGISGIDGQVSTAAGTAFVSDKLNVLITGDLGFFYDSNGLMNKYLKPDFKIIVVNNGGGGIFRFIDGPSTTEHLEEFFEAHHNWKAEQIAEAFGVKYFKAENLSQLERSFSGWLAEKDNPVLLEIFTPAEKNAEVLLEYFRFLKSNG